MAAVAIRNSTLFSDPNLVSLWEMEGNSTDSKGSNNGTDTSITYSAGNGKFGQGAGLAITTTSNISLTSPMHTGTGNFTILAWFKTSHSSLRQMIVSYGKQTASQGLLFYVDATTNKLEYDLWSVVGPVSVATVVDGAWHMAVVTYNGANIILYLDNASGVSQAMSPNIQSGNGSFIGASIETGTPPPYSMDGAIDDIAFFNRALSATEVSNHWSGADALGLGGNMTLNTKKW